MISKKRRDEILTARPDEALGMIRKLIRERTSDRFENQCNVTASHGRYTITFSSSNTGGKITRTYTRRELLDFADGLRKQ